jgi:hypothetical protein
MKKNTYYRNTMVQVSRAANSINMFANAEACIEFTEHLNNDNISLLISDLLKQHIMSRAHNMSLVYSIFIFAKNKKFYEQWPQE